MIRGRRVAAAAVAAAATALTALAVGGMPASSSGLSPAPEVTCPDPHVVFEGDAGAVEDAIPEGAVAVRLCPGSSAPIQAPRDALITDVDAFTQEVNERPADPSCLPTGRGSDFILAFGYPNGSVVRATGDRFTCGGLLVGDVVRGGADVVLEHFLDHLRAQRAETTPPALAHRPACRDPHRGWSVVGEVVDMVKATLCVRFNAMASGSSTPVPVPRADLRVLLSDRSPAPSSRTCPEVERTWSLKGTTVWGDLVGTYDDCGVWTDEAGAQWAPGPDARRVLKRLMRSAEPPIPVVDSWSTPLDVIQAYVDLFNLGKRKAADDLWLKRPRLPLSAPQRVKRLRMDFGAGHESRHGYRLTVYWTEELRTGASRSRNLTVGFRKEHSMVWRLLDVVDHGRTAPPERG